MPLIQGSGALPWPVIVRELRTEARHHSNYWLRLLGAGGLATLFFALLKTDTRPIDDLSMGLFTASHTLLLMAIGIIGPVLTSDAISREARSGTLSLLFATDLTQRSIVLGKSFVHIARLLTLWLAAVPILIIPLIFGGVRWLDIGSAFALEFSVALWALGAGLVASSVFKHPTATLLTAQVLFLSLMGLFRLGLGAACHVQFHAFLPLTTNPQQLDELLREPLPFLTGFMSEGGWSGKLAAFGLPGDHIWWCILGETLLGSILGFGLLLSCAAWRTGRIWQEQPLSLRQVQRRQRWLVPRFWLRNFSRVKHRWLERNPLGWLQRHSTWTRVSELAWFGLVLFIESLIIRSPRPWERYDQAQVWLAILLSLNMTFTAVMIFRKERESGLLELLLVTPMSPGEVIHRQLQGFWRRFFAPAALLLGFASLIVWLDIANPCAFPFARFIIVNYLTTPLIGFYAAARFRSFSAAFFFTAFFSLALPLAGPELAPGLAARIEVFEFWFVSQWTSLPNDSPALDWSIKLCQLLAAWHFGLQLRENLERRSFLLARSQ